MKKFATYINEKLGEKYHVGDYIEHLNFPNFGVGKIISIENRNAVIDFENETGNSRVGARTNHGWLAALNLNYYALTDKRPRKVGRIRWYNHGKLEEGLEHEWKEGDSLKDSRHPEFGIGKIVSMKGNITIEYENKTGIDDDRSPAKLGYGWLTTIESLRSGYYDYIPDIERKKRIRWYKGGKLTEEQFSFEKIESEEIVINLDDYIEEYDNIFKDRYRCIKAVGPIHQVGEIFKLNVLFQGFKKFGMYIKKRELWARSNEEIVDKFEMMQGWDCDAEQIHLKKGDFIVLWPGKGERDKTIKTYSDRERLSSAKKSLNMLGRRFDMGKKILIPASETLKIYNISEFENDIWEKLLGSSKGYGYADGTSNTVIKGTTDRRHDGKEEEVVITRVVYAGLRYGMLEVTTDRKVPKKSYLRGREDYEVEETFYLDITKPISGKKVQWFDPIFDPYGEEDWEGDPNNQIL